MISIFAQTWSALLELLQQNGVTILTTLGFGGAGGYILKHWITKREFNAKVDSTEASTVAVLNDVIQKISERADKIRQESETLMTSRNDCLEREAKAKIREMAKDAEIASLKRALSAETKAAETLRQTVDSQTKMIEELTKEKST